MREDGGLAMSSRNKHLTSGERERALSIRKSLGKAESLIAAGERDCAAIKDALTAVLNEGKPEKIDYVSMVSYDTLHPAPTLDGRAVIAVAAFFGNTRLIDNMIIEPKGDSFTCVY